MTLNYKSLHSKSKQTCKAYLQDKYGWTDETFHTIDWHAHGNTIKQYPLQKKITALKFIHEWNTVGTRNSMIDNSDDTCPLCLSAQETHEHVFACTKNNRERTWKQVEDILKKKNTMPYITNCIKKYLFGLHVERISPSNSHDRHVDNAIVDQALIGENHFCQGRIAKSWGIAQKHYIDRTGASMCFSVENWSRIVCDTMMTACRQIWI